MIDWMPNTFAPRAYADMTKDRVERLRLKHDGPDHEIKDWHAMIDMMDSESTAEFVERYGRSGELPAVISTPGEGDGGE